MSKYSIDENYIVTALPLKYEPGNHDLLLSDSASTPVEIDLGFQLHFRHKSCNKDKKVIYIKFFINCTYSHTVKYCFRFFFCVFEVTHTNKNHTSYCLCMPSRANTRE